MLPARKQVEFVALWSAHSRQVFAYIYSLVANHSDADDVFQETGITLLQKFDEFQPNTSFAAWASRVAYFKALELIRRRRAFEHLDGELLEAIEPEVRRLAFENDPRFEALSQCLSQLPAKDRKLIDARYSGDLPVALIAKRFDRNPSGVYKSFSRIHDLLLDCIRKRLGMGETP